MSNSDDRYEFEMSDEMIGSLIKWLFIVIVILLILLWFCFFKSNIFAQNDNNDSNYIIDQKEMNN